MVQNNLQNRSVQTKPTYETSPYAGFVLWLGSIADDFIAWGGGYSNFKGRDQQLRSFWMSEPTLASALYTISIRDSSYSWTIKGNQPRTVRVVQEMLHNADLGKGWLDFILKWRLDFLTQDNGAYIEIIRETDSPDSVVLGINHLDSNRCRRTGIPEWPVVYTDRLGSDHKLMYYQIVATADFPSPIETANGMGFCAVSRVLREAQFRRDISIRDRERASGMDPKSLHIVGGISRQEMETVLNLHKEHEIQDGKLRYSRPAIMSTIDPSKPATVATLDLAPDPSGFNYDERSRWYISLLAMAIGVDYQDLAPLPARGIGGSAQSEILHQKSKGKGAELFMKTIEHIMNYHVMPRNVTFEYDEKDAFEDKEKADLLLNYAMAGEKYVVSGILTDQAVRNIMLDSGVINQEIFDLASQGAVDVTPETAAPEDEPAGDTAETEKAKIVLSEFAEEERVKWERAMQRDIAEALAKIFGDISDKILPKKAIGKKQSPEDLIESDKFWREFRLALTGAMTPNVRKIYLGAGAFNQSLGLAVDMDGMNLGVFEFTRNYMTPWLAELETTTREGLRQAILTWERGGLGKQGLQDLVNSLEPLFGRTRAERIAATESCRVFDLGNLAANISAGIEYEQWQTANDDRVRDEHRELEGKVFRINEGPRPSDYYNCRCARTPIAAEEAEKIGIE